MKKKEARIIAVMLICAHIRAMDGEQFFNALPEEEQESFTEDELLQIGSASEEILCKLETFWGPVN